MVLEVSVLEGNDVAFLKRNSLTKFISITKGPV